MEGGKLLPNGVRQWWSCGLIGHQHDTLGEAFACASRREGFDEERSKAEAINRGLYEQAGPP